MASFPLLFSLFVSGLVSPGASPVPAKIVTTSPAAQQLMRAAVGAILQADGARAIRLLSGISTDELVSADANFKSCAMSRLTLGEKRFGSMRLFRRQSFVDRAVAIYQIYWRQSISGSDLRVRAKAEAELLRRLSVLLGDSSLADMDASETRLAERLSLHGFQSLMGKTGKLRELMVWSRQTASTASVPLPEGANATPVQYLEGFASLGWTRYFTCGRTGTGGWAKLDGLFVVVPAYGSLNDEKFRVNFLAHESQHFADNKRFRELLGWRLEYRAKLVELAYASETHRTVVQGFLDNRGDDPTEAHSYANKMVVDALLARLNAPSSQTLLTLPIAELQKIAVEALLFDSMQLSGPILPKHGTPRTN